MPSYTPLPPRKPSLPKTYPVCSLEYALEMIYKCCGNIEITERHGKGKNKLIILPEAEQEHKHLTSYGRKSPMNADEMKFTANGHIFMLDGEGHTLTVVSHFFEVPTTNRSVVSAGNLGKNGENNPGLDILEYRREEYIKGEFTYNTDTYGYTVDPFLKCYGHSEYVLEGHTHPDLGVFFSQADRVSGAARAAATPICTFVCDPIRKKMLACVGKDFDPVEIIVFSRVERKNKTIASEPSIGDERSIPPTDRIVQLSKQCLHILGYEGQIRISTKSDKKVFTVKLAIPKKKRRHPDDKSSCKARTRVL